MKIQTLKRIFLHQQSGQELRLADPGAAFTPVEVQYFYAGTYPILTNAKITGPEIKNDEIQYRFESTMGTKG